MEYLAVAEMPHRWSRGIRVGFWRRPYRLPVAWHAVSRHDSIPLALCGFRYTRELHRTWKQTIVSRRCRKCQTLAEEAELRVSTSPLWAIPCVPAITEELTGMTADSARHGVVPAT